MTQTPLFLQTKFYKLKTFLRRSWVFHWFLYFPCFYLFWATFDFQHELLIHILVLCVFWSTHYFPLSISNPTTQDGRAIQLPLTWCYIHELNKKCYIAYRFAPTITIYITYLLYMSFYIRCMRVLGQRPHSWLLIWLSHICRSMCYPFTSYIHINRELYCI